MSFLYQKKTEHELLCEEAIRCGNINDAVFHAAKAAEFAYALARQTPINIAERYIKDAEEWLNIAERIKKHPPSISSPKQNKKEEPQTDNVSQDKEEWLVVEKPSVTFDMIAGMAEAKKVIYDMIIHPMQFPEKARALGLKPGGGILIFGPPGNGKTMFGKAIAHELDAPFFYASGAQIRSKWHGESEQRLRALIRAAKEKPMAVLFLDEVEGLLPRRTGGASVVDNRIVTQFLAEIGGFEETKNILLLLGATNLPWEIDEAVFRTGRFDEKIFIGLPDLPARKGILEMHLGSVPRDQALSFDDWASRLDGYTGSDIVGIIFAAKRICLSRSISSESSPLITNEDMEKAFKQIPPSVTASFMKKYIEFKETRFR